MADSNQRYRRYAGLAFVIVAYVGGIVGWGWAALSVDSGPSPPDTSHTRVETAPSSSASAPDEPTSTSP